jgi:hypothetical protein
MDFKIGDIIENKKLIIRWLVTEVGDWSYQLRDLRSNETSHLPKEEVDGEFKLVSRAAEARSRGFS